MRSRLLIFWVVLALITFVGGLLLPILGKPSNCGIDVLRQSNLRSLVTAMRNYAQESNGQLFPAEEWHEIMDPWLGIDRDDPVYFSDYDSQFYLLPIPWSDLKFPDDVSDVELHRVPFMFEEQKLKDGMTSVSFWGGSVYAVTDEEFAELIDASSAIPIGNRVQRGVP